MDIPEEAVDAAVDALVASRLGDHKGISGEEFVEAARAALEAAAPHLLREAQAALDAVRELHTEDVFRGHLSNGCRTCGGGVGWPCPTIKALDATNPYRSQA